MPITPKCLGIDVGSVRVGTARNVGSLVLPGEVIERTSFKDWLSAHMSDFDLLVFGLPIDLRGDLGTAAASVLEYVDSLELPDSVEIRFVDERLSTSSSQRILRDAGKSTRDTRGSLDAHAAAELLTQAIRMNPVKPGRTLDDWIR